jgi:PAS domain-containing protein
MERRVSQQTTASSVQHAALTREDANPHEDKSVHPFGEIISIRPVEPLETADALRESDARLRAILSSLDDLVFELDKNGVYLVCCPVDTPRNGFTLRTGG